MQIRIRDKHLRKERCQKKNDTEEWNVNGERLQIPPYRGTELVGTAQMVETRLLPELAD